MVFLMTQEHSCRRLITHAENMLGNFYVLGEERQGEQAIARGWQLPGV